MRALVLGVCVLVGLVGAGDASAKLVIQVVSVSTASLVHHHPPAGDVGDTLTMRDRLLNATTQFGKAKNAVVGSDQATLTYLAGGGFKVCGTTKLPTGTIRICGRATQFQGGFSVPVVSGTGAFDGAQGKVLVGGTNNRALNVYELTIRPTA